MPIQPVHKRQYSRVVERTARGGGRDPRRVGLAALGVSVGYAIAVLAPGSAQGRGAFGLIVTLLFVGGCLVLPLPAWREADDRRERARNLMATEALAIVVISTVIALAIR